MSDSSVQSALVSRASITVDYVVSDSTARSMANSAATYARGNSTAASRADSVVVSKLDSSAATGGASDSSNLSALDSKVVSESAIISSNFATTGSQNTSQSVLISTNLSTGESRNTSQSATISVGQSSDGSQNTSQSVLISTATTNASTADSKAVSDALHLNTQDIQPGGRVRLPMGEVAYFNTTGATVTISGTSDGSTNMVAVAPTSTLDNDLEFDNGGSNNGRLRYIGATTRVFHTAVTISGSPATNNDQFVFGVAKNGVVDSTCKIIQKFGTTTDIQSTALHCMVTLATNDYIELYVGNMSASRNVVIKTLNVFALGM
jgi:hypothetical protein